MPIIKTIKGYATSDYSLLNMYPDQMVTDSKKQGDDWIKMNMDYFYNIAIQQYTQNDRKMTKNYELVAGILRREDFGEEPTTRSFVETLIENEDLPAFVKHYCILTPPLNTLKGELSNRPDNIYVKAFDDDSKSEEFEFRTEILTKYIFQTAKDKMASLLATKGQEVESEEELNNLTAEQVNEYMVSYTSLAERWGSNVLEYLKMRLSLKEKSEEGFNDLLIAAREFYLVYEDNTELGFNLKVLNPKTVWYTSPPNTQYTSEPLNKTTGVWSAGTIDVMELSEVIETFKLTEKEIRHLRDMSQQNYLISDRPSNLVHPSKTGPDSIFYNVYDPAVLQYRQIMEANALATHNPNEDFFAANSSISTFGNKFLVVRAYWCSKKKIGKLTYIDLDGQEQVTYVDDVYKEGTHPQEIDIEWTWINQWYQGIKIGTDVYYAQPFDLLDYCPIIGTIYEPKNIQEPTSLVDRMKHYQMLYNVCMNQLFRLLEKDLGVVFLMSQRHIPNKRDGDPQDAMEIWEEEAREKGIIFIDDSPENLGAPSQFNQFTAANLSRSQEIQARYNLAVQIRTECWRLVGLSEQRLGGVQATETATATNTALSQSYAQTEPYFAKHEYLINRVYQALLDAALYKQAQSDESILASISSEGANQFVKVNGSDLKLRNLGVYVTSRSQDARNLQELKQYAQAMLQNGASPYEIALLHDTKSMRHIKETFKKLKDKMDEFQQTQQQIEQQKIEQAQQQFEQAQQLAQLQDEKNKAFEAFEAEQDRLNDLQIAYIQASSKEQSTTPPDTSQFQIQEQQNYHNYQLKLQELTQKQQQILSQTQLAAQKLDIDKEKLNVEREKMKNDLTIARENRTASEIKAKRNKSK